MALVVKDRVRETSTTTGTGTLTLAGAVAGFQTFSSAIGNGNTTYYTITNNTEWEVGLGTVGAGTLARTTVLSSSNAGAAVTFSAGTKDVFCSYPASKALYTDEFGNAIGLGTVASTTTLTNATGLPISTGVSGLGTGIATALGTNVGTAGSVVTNGGALGTPASGTLTNCTFPTLNQNTTGTAAGLSSTLVATSGGTGTATSFTTGSVVFAGASGVYSQNNAGFFWDNTNSRLGIGTTAPSIALDVRSPAASGANADVAYFMNPVNNVTATAATIKIGATSVTTRYSYIQSLISSGANGQSLCFGTNANGATPTEKMRIDDAGNVGIGTTTPANKFEVFGNSVRNTARASSTAGFVQIEAQAFDYWSTPTYTGTSLLQYGSTATGTTVGLSNANLGALVFQNSSGGLIYTNGATPIVIGTTNVERMRIHASGGVSINNTTDPGAGNLTVTGKISDSKGDVRAAPIQSKTAAYVLVATDAGQTISITTGGVTVNASVFSAGDMVSIFNNSGSSQTITQGTNVTLRLTGTATTGNRTLAQYGVATLLCVIGGATPTFACTGSGLT